MCLLLSRLRGPLSKGFENRFFSSFLIPYVIENLPGGGERAYDIYSRLLRDRIICLHSQVNSQVASSIIAQLLFLEGENNERPIHLYINSPGGSVTDGLAIYDTMQLIKAPVYTIAMGMAASMGSFLLAAGAPGHRKALPNSRIMVHQPSGGATGPAADIEIAAKEILRLRTLLNEIYARHTGQSLSTIERALDRDRYMTPEEAAGFGLIDGVLNATPSRQIL
ncbi:ATP-dependent Clp protease proteolytic subunit 1 [Mitosporidium daphniae]